jgi:hypothetical protein
MSIPKCENFLVLHPSTNSEQWKWIISVVLSEWLGIFPILLEHDKQVIEIKFGKNFINVPCDFFSVTLEGFPWAGYIPSLPLANWIYPKELEIPLEGPALRSIPILFGSPDFKIHSDRSIEIGIDIFGSAFFMLSRFEEVFQEHTDAHLRYTGEGSFSTRSGILNRPLIDEYTEILRRCLNFVWPSLELPRRIGQKIVTCDVDEPFERWIGGPKDFVKGIAGALLKRRSLAIAKRRLLNGLLSLLGNYKYDPCWTFNWYMDICEKHNKQAEFYFMTQRGAHGLDASYSVDSNRIQRLLKIIHDRGHVIGLHGSYNSFNSAERLTAEREKLKMACERAGVNQEVYLSRQHYLRWNARITPDCQDSAGFQLDSTVGYADLPGFRSGTSRTFTMWSWKKMTPLKLQQRPLILMEGTILSDVYMNATEDAERLINSLSREALSHGGDYTILWHNSYLTTPTDRHLFEQTIA